MKTKTVWHKCPSVARVGLWFYFAKVNGLSVWISRCFWSGAWRVESDSLQVKNYKQRYGLDFKTAAAARKWSEKHVII